jgi:hypothetical protein
MKKLSHQQLIKTKRLLISTKKRLTKLEKIPLTDRGHIDNEDVVKLRIIRKHLEELIKSQKVKRK